MLCSIHITNCTLYVFIVFFYCIPTVLFILFNIKYSGGSRVLEIKKKKLKNTICIISIIIFYTSRKRIPVQIAFYSIFVEKKKKL